MIYTDAELKEKIHEMLKDFETEVVEFKEANNSYSFKDIGKYFSALGNEANIRGKSEGWLIFGITNKGEFKGTDYRKSGNLQSLKKEIIYRGFRRHGMEQHGLESMNRWYHFQ